MIRHFLFLILSLFFLLPMFGCADQAAFNNYLASFDNAADAYYTAADKPLFEIELPSPQEGKPYKITVNREVKRMAPEQIKDSEWAPVANSAIGVAGGVAGGYIAGETVLGVAEAVGSSAGKHFDIRTNEGGDISIDRSFVDQKSTVIGTNNTSILDGQRHEAGINTEPGTPEPSDEE